MNIMNETLQKKNPLFDGDELAESVWRNKYAARGEEFPTDMQRRMALQFSRIEKKYKNQMSYDEIFYLLKDFKYVIPQGSIMFGLGNKDVNASLSNCVVIDSPKDSYGGILESDEQLAQLMKRRCGVGMDISTLRPKDSKVNNAAKTSTGAVSFMERFSNTTREVAQGSRRGALLLSIIDSHPDILDFIKVKDDLTKVTGANISVQLTDEFMNAVDKDLDWDLKFKDEVLDTVKATEIWETLITQAHKRAEPGILFKTKQDKYSTSSAYPGFENVTTNPCGEIPLGPFDSCRLIAMNMLSYVINPYTDKAYFDFVLWKNHVYKAQKLNDDVVDLEIESIDRIIKVISDSDEPDHLKDREINLWKKLRKTGSTGRRTGLGFTGLGDTLAALGLKYGSEESIEAIDRIMRAKMLAEFESSIDMAKDRGTFEVFDKRIERQSEFNKFLWRTSPDLYRKMLDQGRRNISLSTVAPTGSLSLLAGVTSGIEPLFQPFYTRRKKINPNDPDETVAFVDKLGDSWAEYKVIHPEFKKWMLLTTPWEFSKDIGELTDDELDSWFKKSPWYGSTANDIPWENRIKLQSTIQKYTTHSISSTINLPRDTTSDEVSDIYMEAWKQGLKGVTVYVDGSRDGVLINNEDERDSSEFSYKDAHKRPKMIPCDIHITKYRGDEFYVIVGLLEGKPYEVFASINDWGLKPMKAFITKKGGGVYDLLTDDNKVILSNVTENMNNEEEASTRLLSLALRHGADITFAVEQLRKSQGDITAFSKSIARVLNKYTKERIANQCPECQSKLVMEEGCIKCSSCGYSKCG